MPPRDPSPGLAVALQAVPVSRASAALRPIHPRLPAWLASRLQRWTYVGPPTASGGGGGNKGGLESPSSQRAAEQAAVAMELRHACPFTSPSAEAFAETVPVRLLAIAARSSGTVDPARLWTTLLCMAFLRVQTCHFLVKARVRGGGGSIPKRSMLPRASKSLSPILPGGRRGIPVGRATDSRPPFRDKSPLRRRSLGRRGRMA